jgi:hypothetical protein
LRIPGFDRLLARWLIALGVSCALIPAGPTATVRSVAAQAAVGATLKVLAPPVEVDFSSLGSFGPAGDGQTLQQGDVIRTGPGGVALLTFFDGSESQLGSDSQVLIEQAEANPAPQISVMQTAGVTVNHVVSMPPGGSFRTNTPAVTGLVRGTSYIVVVGSSADESSDEASSQPATSVVLLTDRDGHVGRVDVVASGSPDAPAIQLARSGDAAGAASGQGPTAANLAPTFREALERVANAHSDPDAAREAEHHARVLAAVMTHARSSEPIESILEKRAGTREIGLDRPVPVHELPKWDNARLEQRERSAKESNVSKGSPANASPFAERSTQSDKPKHAGPATRSATDSQSGGDKSATSSAPAHAAPKSSAEPAATLVVSQPPTGHSDNKDNKDKDGKKDS